MHAERLNFEKLNFKLLYLSLLGHSIPKIDILANVIDIVFVQNVRSSQVGTN